MVEESLWVVMGDASMFVPFRFLAWMMSEGWKPKQQKKHRSALRTLDRFSCCFRFHFRRIMRCGNRSGRGISMVRYGRCIDVLVVSVSGLDDE